MRWKLGAALLLGKKKKVEEKRTESEPRRQSGNPEQRLRRAISGVDSWDSAESCKS